MSVLSTDFSESTFDNNINNETFSQHFQNIRDASNNIRPDAIPALAKRIEENPSLRPFYVNAINDKETNLVKQKLHAAILDDLAREIRGAVKDRTILITQNLNASEEKQLEASFPQYHFKYHPSDNNPHAFAAAHRVCEFISLQDKIGYKIENDYSQYLKTHHVDAYMIDLGSNYPNIVSKRMRFVHGCSPVIDSNDANRFVNRLNSFQNFINNGPTVSTSEGKKLKQIGAVLTGVNENSTQLCLKRAQNCNVTALYGVCLHAIYDMSLDDIAVLMVRKKMRTLVGTFIYDSAMLTTMRGTINYLNVHYLISRATDEIVFVFANDSSNCYKHKFSSYTKLIFTPFFFSKNGKEVFHVELLENVNGVQFFRINRQLVPPVGISKRIHNVCLGHLDGSYQVTFVIRSPASVAEFVNSLTDIFRSINSLRERNRMTSTTPDGHNYALSHIFEASDITAYDLTDGRMTIKFFENKDMVEKMIAYALSATEKKFTPSQLFSYARSLYSKIFVGKSVIYNYSEMHSMKLFVLCYAVYVYVYVNKFEMGKSLHDIKEEIDFNRELEEKSLFGKLCAVRPKRTVRDVTTFFGKLDAYLYNAAKCDIDVLTWFAIPDPYFLLEFKPKIGSRNSFSVSIPTTYQELLSSDIINTLNDNLGHAEICENPQPVVSSPLTDYLPIDMSSNVTGEKIFLATPIEFNEKSILTFTGTLRRLAADRSISSFALKFPFFIPVTERDLLLEEVVTMTGGFRLDSHIIIFYRKMFTEFFLLNRFRRMLNCENRYWKGICAAKLYINDDLAISNRVTIHFNDLVENFLIDKTKPNYKISTFKNTPETAFDNLASMLDHIDGSRISRAISTIENHKTHIFNRCYSKISEIFSAYPFLRNGSRFLDVCCAPGGFSKYLVEKGMTGDGLTHYSRVNMKFESASFDLLSSMIPHFDLLDDYSYRKLRKIINNRKYDLVLADGALPGDYGTQEDDNYFLFLRETDLAVSVLNESGNYIIKIFSFISRKTQALLYYLYQNFDSISFFKPPSSKSSNKEVYVVCQRYRARIPLTLSTVKPNQFEFLMDPFFSIFIDRLKPIAKCFQEKALEGLRVLLEMVYSDDFPKDESPLEEEPLAVQLCKPEPTVASTPFISRYALELLLRQGWAGLGCPLREEAIIDPIILEEKFFFNCDTFQKNNKRGTEKLGITFVSGGVYQPSGSTVQIDEVTEDEKPDDRSILDNLITASGPAGSDVSSVNSADTGDRSSETVSVDDRESTKSQLGDREYSATYRFMFSHKGELKKIKFSLSKTLKKTLYSSVRFPLDTKGDGQCLYHALVMGLVRPSVLKSALPGSGADYEQEIVSFGGMTILRIFSEVFNTQIVVFDVNNHIVHSIGDAKERYIELYYDGTHYQTLIRVCPTSTFPTVLDYKNLTNDQFRSIDLGLLKRKCVCHSTIGKLRALMPTTRYRSNLFKMIFFHSTNGFLVVDSIFNATTLYRGPSRPVVSFSFAELEEAYCRTAAGYCFNIMLDDAGNVLNLLELIQSIARALNSCKGSRVKFLIPKGLDLSAVVSLELLDNFDYDFEISGEVNVKPHPLPILPQIDRYNSMVNSIKEIMYVWNVTESHVAGTLESTFNEVMYFVNNKIALKAVDTSFGIIDVLEGKFIHMPATVFDDSSYAYDPEKKNFFELPDDFFRRLKIPDSDTRYVVINKSTRIMNEKALMEPVSAIGGTYDRRRLNFKLNYVEGVPGAGKSHWILSRLSKIINLDQCVFTATKESADDMRERFVKLHGVDVSKLTKREKIVLRLKFRNVDSALINVHRYNSVSVVMLDEAGMKHDGQWIALCHILCPLEVHVVRDLMQITYFNAEGIPTRYHILPKFSSDTEEPLTVSHRITCDAACFLNSHSGYQRKVTTRNHILRSINTKLIRGVVDVPKRDDAVYLTFTKTEAKDLNDNGIPAVTIGTYQGKENDVIYLVRLNDKNSNPLYEAINQQVVAISRHRKIFVYYTTIRDQFYHRLMAIVDSPDQVIREYTHDNLRGGAHIYNTARNLDENFRPYPRLFANRQTPDYNVEIRPAFSTNLNFESNLLVDVLLNHGATGYTAMKPMLIPDYNNTIDYDYIAPAEPPFVDYAVNTIQTNVDLLFPGSTIHPRRHDYDLFIHQNLQIACSDFSIRDGDVYHKRDTLSSELRTAMQETMPMVNFTLLKAFNERNGGAPELAGRGDADFQSDKMVETFEEVYVVDKLLYNSYKTNPIALNVDTMTEWLNTQSSDVLQELMADEDFSIFDKYLNSYFFILKNNAKPTLDQNPHEKFASPQGIAFQGKKINLLFCSLVKEIKTRAAAVMSPTKVTNTDMAPIDLQNLLNFRMPPKRFFKYLRRIEFDISKYDKSQHLICLLAEIKLLVKLGFPEEYVAIWLFMHVSSTLYSMATKFQAFVEYQRKSGDAMTFFGNTLMLMMLLASVMDLRDAFCLFAGDDSYIMVDSFVDMQTAQEILGSAFNFEAKVFEYRYPYFCSKFLLPVDEDRWLVIPDPVKLSIKLGRSDLVSFDHVEQYRVSLVDIVSAYADFADHDLIEDAIFERYKARTSGDFISALYWLVNDKAQFHALYYLDDRDELVERTMLPSLDI